MDELIDMSGLDRKDYWIVEFQGVEWEFLLAKLKRDLKLEELPSKEMAMLLTYNVETHIPAAWLRKKHVPVSYLVTMTGQDLKTIETEPVIRLSVRERPELPAPTVGYWGEA